MRIVCNVPDFVGRLLYGLFGDASEEIDIRVESRKSGSRTKFFWSAWDRGGEFQGSGSPGGYATPRAAEHAVKRFMNSKPRFTMGNGGSVT